MADPDSRSRPQVKDLHTYTKRSRSAGNFKNSPFYDKFVFFEQGLNEKLCKQNTSKETSNAPGKTVEGRPVTYPKDRGFEDKRLQEHTQIITDKMSGSRLSSFTSKSHTCSIMFLASEETQPKTPSQVGTFNQINSNNAKLKSRSMSNISIIQLQDTTPESASTEHSSSLPYVHRQRKNSILENSKSNPSIHESSTSALTTITKPWKASCTSAEAESNLKTISHSLNSSVCEDLCNVSSIQTQACQYPSHESKLRVSLVSEFSKSSRKDTQHVNTDSGSSSNCILPIGDFHESVLKENETSSSPSIELPSSPTRKISKASIKLVCANKTEADQKDGKNRKIHVLKTHSSLLQKAAEPSPSPRLNEWLSSVMKLQQERQANDWILPEDEPSASNLDAPFSQDSNDPNRISCISMNSKSPTLNTRQWSSKGINTDISLAPQSMHHLSHTKAISYFKKVMSNDMEAINDYSNYNLKDSPGLSRYYCSICCSLTNNEPNYSSYINSSKPRHSTAVLSRNSHSGGSLCYCEHFAEGKLTTASPNMSSSLATSSKPTRQCHVAKLVARNEDKTQKFDSQTLGSEITICVTTEDDRPGKPSKGQSLSGESCVEDVSANEKIMEDCERSVDTRERASASKGKSPHYMLPCGHATTEEGDNSRDLFSPRNSIGSINSDVSAFSYKSSNADSAVDLGPPDDDHELEYADFLARFKAWKMSSVTLNENITESRENEALSMQDSPDQRVCADKGACLENIPTHGASRNRNIQSNPLFPTGRSSDIKQIINKDQNELRNIESLSCQNVQCELKDYKLDMANQSTMKTHQADRHHSLTKASHSKEFLTSALDYLNCYSTNNDHHKSQQFTNVELENTSSEVQYLTSQYSYQGTCDDGSVATFEQLRSLDTRRWHTVDQLTNQTQYEIYSQKGESHNEQTIPEFIISDHSDHTNHIASPFDFGEAGLNTESPTPSRPPSSLGSSEFDLLDIESRGMLRCGSQTSLCSIASTCSTCTVQSDSDSEVPTKKTGNTAYHKWKIVLLEFEENVGCQVANICKVM